MSRWVQAPIIPGHEFVGEVADISEKDSDRLGINIGDQVTSEQIVACNNCLYCKKGKRWLCQEHDIYGFRKAVPGAFSQVWIASLTGPMEPNCFLTTTKRIVLFRSS
mmetsp:Transcript_37746/g.150472  ORF Transcript_37746/g.150472 Transcript_37746/m.150472 type:complete len:107 (+) Transcript_37746:413-733(+)